MLVILLYQGLSDRYRRGRIQADSDSYQW